MIRLLRISSLLEWTQAPLPWSRRAGLLKSAIAEAAEAAPALLAFGQLSDRDFVSIANGLETLQGTITEMQSRSQSLSSSLSPTSEDSVFQTTIAVGKRAIELVHASIGADFALDAQFAALESLVESCESIRSEFDKNRVIFRSLAVGFAIEAARCDTMHQGVFKTVASDFQRIDKSIETTIEDSFNQIANILTQLNVHKRRWREKVEKTGSSIEERLANVRESVFNLETDLKPCNEICQRFAASVDNLNQDLFPILTSLQSQDITRQRLEHVAQNLEAMAEQSKAKRPAARDLPELLATAAIQGEQLDETYDLISSSATQALDGIQNSLTTANDVGQQLDTLQQRLNKQFGDGQLVYTFKENIDAITTITEASQEVHSHIDELDQEVRSVIQTFDTQISASQFDISLIALNAQVAASRLTHGGALERLSQETSVIAVANQKTSKDLSDKLSSALSALSASRKESVALVDALVDEKSALLSLTKDIDQRLTCFISEMLEQSTRMHQDSSSANEEVRSLLQNLSFQNHISQHLDPARAAIGNLTVACREAIGKRALTKSSVESLNRKADQYTMQSERDLHEKVCSGLSSQTCEIEMF